MVEREVKELIQPEHDSVERGFEATAASDGTSNVPVAFDSDAAVAKSEEVGLPYLATVG